MYESWLPGRSFIEADVIRWHEGVFQRKGARGRRSVRIGERLVVAEVLGDADEEGWVYLLVLKSEVTKEEQGRRVPPLPKGETKRKRATITRGKVERMVWSDESARSALVRERRLKRPSSFIPST